MLKDVTLGQFFPGNSFVHKLDPRTKLVMTVFYIVALFCAKNAAGYIAVFLFLVCAVIFSNTSVKMLVSGLKPVVIILIFTCVLNMIYTRTGTPLVSFWIITVTTDGVKTAVFMMARIIMLIMGTSIMTYTTSPLDLTDGLERLLSPLKKLRMPIHEMGMIMSIALRFIPTIIEETDKIINAQKARGADFETGGLFKKAKAMIPILVPLFISAFRRADELAVAMESRCYHGDNGRTRMKILKYGARDAFGYLLCVLLPAAVLLLGRI